MRFDNYARHVGRRTMRGKEYEWFEWEVFMAEPPEVVARVREVEYQLHPTFPNPIRTVDDRESRFALRVRGWGMFRLLITVLMEDGSVEKTKYMLSFQKPWPEGHE